MQESSRVEGIMQSNLPFPIKLWKVFNERRNAFLKELQDAGFRGREYSDAVCQYDKQATGSFNKILGGDTSE